MCSYVLKPHNLILDSDFFWGVKRIAQGHEFLCPGVTSEKLGVCIFYRPAKRRPYGGLSVNGVVQYPINFLRLFQDVYSHFRLEPAWELTERENLECTECLLVR